MWKNFSYIFGRALRESGQALERVALRTNEVETYKTFCTIASHPTLSLSPFPGCSESPTSLQTLWKEPKTRCNQFRGSQRRYCRRRSPRSRCLGLVRSCSSSRLQQDQDRRGIKHWRQHCGARSLQVQFVWCTQPHPHRPVGCSW